MPNENVFHPRQTLPPELPTIVVATSEELSIAENYFSMEDEEKRKAALQLFAKKAKFFVGDEKKAQTKVTRLASTSVMIFGKPQLMVPNSIIQNEEMFLTQKEKANEYLSKVLNVFVNEEKTTTYLDKMVNEIYELILKSHPREGEVIHLGTMERELLTPDCGRNRLTAEFCNLLLMHLKEKIIKNKQPWIVKSDRVFGIKHRTTRAESSGIDRLALLPLMLYQSRDVDEKITPDEKLIIIDDHIQTGSSLVVAASSAISEKANVLGVTCVTAHKNSKFLNIQPEVKEFITSLLPEGEKDLASLNRILKHVELNIETLTNVEGIILAAIFCDPRNQEQRTQFEGLLQKFDVSHTVNYALFKNQKNSLWEEFEKPKVEFKDFENKLKEAASKRYSVPYTKQVVVSDEEGRNIRKEIDKRANLPWILFDFDDTLHNLENYTYETFQKIIQKYSNVVIPTEEIKEKRRLLKETGQYQYQTMLLDYIKECKPTVEVTTQSITKDYEILKNLEPFVPKMCREDFLAIRNKYRIGIITDGATFPCKVSKMKEYYGVEIDGYIHNQPGMPKKPDLEMYRQFCETYQVKEKPVAYVGDSKELDGGMAEKAKLKFIKVDPAKSMIDMKEFNKELSAFEEQRKASRRNLELIKTHFLKGALKSSEEPIRKMAL